MTKSIVFALGAAIAFFATPFVGATWNSYGSAEPDTPFDSSTFMWSGPPGTITNRIYFNVYSTTSTVAGGGMNPNVGLVGSQIESPLLEQEYAVLGVWTDCNGDGYIGMLETAAREYRSELLVGGSPVCPARTGGTNCWTTGSPCPAWPHTGFNNYNGWVTELIPIGSGETTGGDRRVIKDIDAAVWGDFGRPNEPSTTAGGTCAISPPPRGSLQSTGGFLSYAECRFGLLETWNTAMDAGGDPLGLRFADDDDGRSGALGQFGTLGSTDSNQAIVRPFDCDQPYLVPFGDLPSALNDFDNRGIRPPSLTHVNPGGSVAGTINYTFEAGPFPNSPSDAQNKPESSDCDTSNDYGEQPYSLVESRDFSGTSATDKREAIWNFAFTTMSRGGVPLGGLTGAAGGPSDAGLEPVNGVCLVCQESEWFGGSTLTKAGTPPGPRSLAIRADLGNADVGVDIAGAYWLSFYAYVGATSTAAGSLPGGGATGTYGGAQCGGATSGVHNGWNCDRSLWNRNPDGSPKQDPFNALSYPGKPYNLRDVDCYDGNTGLGIGVEPAFFGPSPCP